MGLDEYRRKRDFGRTPEPRGDKRADAASKLQFVVQKHAASRMHYDFRLELDGVLLSWAVPKGPSLNPKERRLAVQTEDHPIDYAEFEGVIPEHQYGGGTVLVWDRGYWTPEGDPDRGMHKGKLDFRLHGDKLRGRWTLVRMPPKSARKADKNNWLLIKRRDDAAGDPQAPEIVDSRPESVLSGRALDEVAEAADRVWHPSSGERSAGKVHQVGRPSTVAGAVRAAVPDQVAPQLATLVERVPADTGWLHEAKLDGYRLLCRVDGDRVALLTRRGNDWTDRFSAIVQAAGSLPCTSTVLDGEAVVFDARGLSDFQVLQNAIGRRDSNIVLVAFDLLYLDGWDLRGAPLRARKELLRLLLSDSPPAIRYGDHIEGKGSDFFREACQAGLEGIVSKRADSPYVGKRARSWLKIKCHKREEMVIIGFTEPSGSRVGFGALLLATRSGPEDALHYAGKVGTGFDDQTLRSLHQRLQGLVRATPPADAAPRGRDARGVHWVEPELVAEIAFGDWTHDGIVRHSTFRGLREDKPASEVAEERPAADPVSQPAKQSARPPRRASDKPTSVAGVKLTHPSKVLYPDQGVTKLQLARYYQQIADSALPYMVDRPLTLVRCPDGQHEDCFYQKHISGRKPAAVASVVIKPGEPPYAMVSGAGSLIGLVQLGVLELHVWGSRADNLEHPDIIVFDLDPSEELPWGAVVEAAFELRERLEALGLTAFVRLTGGKGLHLVVPIPAGPSWDQVKDFSRQMAEQMVRDHPSRFTAKLTKQGRGGKIFIDYLRNARESTAIAAYSARAKPGAPVALPIEWDELDPDAASPPRYSVLEVPELIRKRPRDPWANFEEARRRVGSLLSQ